MMKVQINMSFQVSILLHYRTLHNANLKHPWVLGP